MSPIIHVRKVVLGLSQAEFATLVGVSQGTISKWESGEGAPDRDELARIREGAKARGIEWSDSWFFEVPFDRVAS